MPGSNWSDLRALYDAAEVVVQGRDGIWLSAESAARQRSLPAGVITAWNPGRARPGAAANREANDRLATRLALREWEVWPSDGRSPDGAFHEPGFCVWQPDVAALRALGRDFSQLAIYTIDPDGTRWTLACDDEV